MEGDVGVFFSSKGEVLEFVVLASKGIDFLVSTGSSVLVGAGLFEVSDLLLELHPRIKMMAKIDIVVANICNL